ncbi:MAG: hypothetical protein K8R36_10910 [Planctomycetales bacterium]|nr:hypothetical protein [Planctomycetales bacterium]
MMNVLKLRLPRIRWRFQFSLFTLLGVVTIVAVVLGVAPIVRMELALRALSNKDVKVQGGFVGLRVDLDSPVAEYFKRSGPKANWRLESALADPNRFAAAHVLLSFINQKRIHSNHSQWNEMQISCGADDEFPTEQIPKLQEFWRNRLNANQPSKK